MRSTGDFRSWLLWAFLFVFVTCAATFVVRDSKSTSQWNPSPRSTSGRTLDPELESLIVHEEFVPAFARAVDRLVTRVASTGWRDRETLFRLHQVARIAHLGGDQTMAEAAADLALRLRRDTLGSFDPDVAESLHLRGLIARYLHERELSWSCYAEAEEILNRNGRADSVMMANVKQAQASWLRPVDHDATIELLKQALELRRRSAESNPFDVADTLTWLGWNLSRAGRHEEALPYLHEAEDRLRAHGLAQHSLIGTILHLYASNLLLEGNAEGSLAVFREAASQYDNARDKYLPILGRRKMTLEVYYDLAQALLVLGRGEEAWQAIQRGSGALTSDFLAMRRWANASPDELRVNDAVRQRYLETKDLLISFRAGKLPGGVEQESELLLNKLLVRSQLYQQEQKGLAEYRLQTPTLAQIQTALPPHTAIVGRFYAMMGSLLSGTGGAVQYSEWIYVLRSSGPIVWIPAVRSLDVDEFNAYWAENAKHSRALRRAASWRTRVDSDPEFDQQINDRCSTLLGPALESLDDVDTVIFERFGEPCGQFALANGTLFGDRFDSSEVPSAAVYLFLVEERTRKGTSPLASVLAVGDPEFFDFAAPLATDDESTATSSNGHRAVRVEELARVPQSGTEARSVSSLFRVATLLVDEGASEERIRDLVADERLGEFDVIHLATHALADARPERCGLAFAPSADSDGVIDVEDILYRWRLDGAIVTLSGCWTRRLAGMVHSEYYGVVQALLAAGASSVLSATVPADDWATAELMTRFYENLTGHYDDVRDGLQGIAMPPGRALRDAKRWLREYTLPDGTHPFQHPVYWDNFVLLGLPN
jgi:tetratricopeptide (TPR) repeat protein